jgi:hypothetical protein
MPKQLIQVFKPYQTTKAENKVNIKVVILDEIYNFVVLNFFHLDSSDVQILNIRFKIVIMKGQYLFTVHKLAVRYSGFQSVA